MAPAIPAIIGASRVACSATDPQAHRRILGYSPARMKKVPAPVALLALVLGLTLGAPRPAPAQTGTKLAETAFDSAQGLGPSWRDLGWAPREIAAGKPASLDMADRAGWILSRKGLRGTFGALSVLYFAPPGFGDFLEVWVGGSNPGSFPKVAVGPDLQRPAGSGWIEAVVPMYLLNPRGAAFDQVVVRARVDVGHRRVSIARVGFTPGDGKEKPAPVAVTGGRPARFQVDCRAAARPISPLIYGIGGMDKENSQFDMGISAKRWGGNPNTRYNWKLGNAWNAGADYFFRNVDYGNNPKGSYDDELEAFHAKGIPVALTVPTIGWVAKDTSSYSFPVSVFGPQEVVATENPDMGNGKSKEGVALPPTMPPVRTSVAAPPDFIAGWLTAIREKDKKRGRTINMVILDNEPMLWHSTHRDVHPLPASYNELLNRTISYGTAVRKAYPEVQIAGPAEWGWSNYFYSGVDTMAGINVAPDRKAHGNVPLIPWWLYNVRAYERKNKIKLIDILDVHYYPQANGIGVEKSGNTDRATNALRIRSTRSLWDPSYTDESWIADQVELIPRLRRWVTENAPGLGISLGEYSFGAAEHQSGGLAQAEALGRFGTEGLTAAYYWFYPGKNTPVYWAFRAFRNFDGQGGKFLDRSVPASGRVPNASLFVSRSESTDHLVAVLLNLDPDQAMAADIDLGTCGPAYRERAFTYTGGPNGFVATAPSQLRDGILHRSVPPYSITVLDLSAPGR
jgi:hypothetical protein